MGIRAATTFDLVSIDTIYNQAIEEQLTADRQPLSATARQQWLDAHQNNRFPVFVYELNQQVVGWLSFSAYRSGRAAFDNTAEISYYVDRNYRQKGIGTALIQFAKELAAQNAFKNLLAMVLEWNTGSIRLLQKSGFETWGYLPKVANFDGTVCGHLYLGINL